MNQRCICSSVVQHVCCKVEEVMNAAQSKLERCCPVHIGNNSQSNYLFLSSSQPPMICSTFSLFFHIHYFLSHLEAGLKLSEGPSTLLLTALLKPGGGKMQQCRFYPLQSLSCFSLITSSGCSENKS